jgi:hypothetical protein
VDGKVKGRPIYFSTVSIVSIVDCIEESVMNLKADITLKVSASKVPERYNHASVGHPAFGSHKSQLLLASTSRVETSSD